MFIKSHRQLKLINNFTNQITYFMSIKLNAIRFALLLALLCFAGGIDAQTVKVNVKDSNGEPVIGATVKEKDTSNGGMTNLDGQVTVNLTNPKNPLVISYLGMKTKEVDVKGQSSINVTMEDDMAMLDDVVVIGYGTVRKKDLTGAVATVSAQDIVAVPVSNPMEALTGKLSGVQVTTTEGSPDADVKIRVRGGGSITQSNDPLFIVDGFPVDNINDISPSDIEDITVLKDASSTAIYGSRGANGVILVTTKKGNEGKTSVSYNAYYSWKKVANSLDVLSPADYAAWQYELATLKGNQAKYTDYFGAFEDISMYDGIPTNDWQDQTYGRVGHTFNHNLNINGGTDKMKYSFNYAHIDDKAIMKSSSYKRDNASLKINQKPVKNVTLDYSARFSRTKIYGGGANDQTSSYNTDRRLRYAVQYTPFPVEGISGSSEDTDVNSNFYSPLTSLRDNDRQQTRTQFNLGASMTWEIFKNFKFKTEFGYDVYRNDVKRYWGVSTYYVQNVPAAENQGLPAVMLDKMNRNKFRNTNTVNYDFKQIFGKESKHHLNALLGQEYIIDKRESLTNIVHGFPTSFSAIDCWNLTTQGKPYDITDYYYPDDKLLSFFGRVNYDFDGNYLITATLRADGSSKFSKGNQWGYFPSVAAAWRISSEPFMSGTKDWLDDLKLRLSYGTAGNNNIPSGVSLEQEYEAKSTSWINGYSSYWAPSKTMSNPDLTWETTITRNIGLDYVLWGGKLNGSFEAYWNSTKDLLIQYPVAGTGYDIQYRNMGKTRNRGFEFSINWHAVNTKNYGLTLGANVSFNKNKVVSLGGLESMDNINTGWASSEIDQDFVIAVGQPIGQIYGYVSDGRYEVSDFDVEASQAAGKWILKEGVADASSVLGASVQPGMMKLKEIKDEKTGSVTTQDRKVIGDTNPSCIGGFNISARVYNFDLTANFNWTLGNDVYNANKIEFTQTSKYYYRNLITDMEKGKRWTNINSNGELLNWNNAAELAALNSNTTTWSPYTGKYVLTDDAVEDGSFLRLATLTLGYTLPKSVLKKLGIETLRLYATCYNVFCLTGYSGYDPEVSAIRRTNMTPGVDYSAYPKSRQFLIGVNLNF